MSRTRPAALAGSWYPGNPDALITDLDRYLEAADPASRPAGRALLAVVPHAGYVYSGESAGRLYGLLTGPPPKTVVILAPNHRTPLDLIALPEAEAFATPLGEVRINNGAVEQLAECPAFTRDDRAHAEEHAVEIQLPFLQRLWPDNTPTIVPMLVPRLNAARRDAAAGALRELLPSSASSAGETLLLVSSDFTHYGSAFGFVPFTSDIPASLERLDAGAILKILAADPNELIAYGENTGITMCGLQATALALGAGLPEGYEAALIDYRRSGDRDGDYSHSVSYASILMTDGPTETAGPGS
jgi:MEMO1 family protein